MEEPGPASLCLKLLPQTQIVILLPLFYVLTHSWWNSTAIVASLVLILFYFRIAPVAQSAADIVFTPNDPQVIAHKGGYSDAPGNTLAAIREVNCKFKNSARTWSLCPAPLLDRQFPKKIYISIYFFRQARFSKRNLQFYFLDQKKIIMQFFFSLAYLPYFFSDRYRKPEKYIPLIRNPIGTAC